MVACRQLGFETGVFPSSRTARDSGNGTAPPWLSALQCSGDEAAVLDCVTSGLGETWSCGRVPELRCFNSSTSSSRGSYPDQHAGSHTPACHILNGMAASEADSVAHTGTIAVALSASVADNCPAGVNTAAAMDVLQVRAQHRRCHPDSHAHSHDRGYGRLCVFGCRQEWAMTCAVARCVGLWCVLVVSWVCGVPGCALRCYLPRWLCPPITVTVAMLDVGA